MSSSSGAAGDSFVEGVRINCSADLGDGGLFKKVQVPLNDPIFTKGEICPVASLLGLKLRAMQLPKPKVKEPQMLDNQPATYMMIDTISGFAGPKWQRQAGTTLFVRDDKKPLTPEHLEALWMFNDRILDYFGDDDDQARAMMCLDEWNKFWPSYKRGQISTIQNYDAGRDRSDEIRAWENASNPLSNL